MLGCRVAIDTDTATFMANGILTMYCSKLVLHTERQGQSFSSEHDNVGDRTTRNHSAEQLQARSRSPAENVRHDRMHSEKRAFVSSEACHRRDGGDRDTIARAFRDAEQSS